MHDKLIYFVHFTDYCYQSLKIVTSIIFPISSKPRIMGWHFILKTHSSITQKLLTRILTLFVKILEKLSGK